MMRHGRNAKPCSCALVFRTFPHRRAAGTLFARVLVTPLETGAGGRVGGGWIQAQGRVLAVASVQVGSPSGRSRRRDWRTRAISLSNIGALTSPTQPAPRGGGPDFGQRGHSNLFW